MPALPPEPWRAFLADLDDVLASHGQAEVATLHCVGGFVVAMCYDLARSTGDLDVFSVAPAAALALLIEHGGEGRPIANKHGVHIDANSRIATLPYNYEDRLTEIFAGTFRKLRLLVPDRYDLALSKLERNIDRDRDDLLLLARQDFDVEVFRERYASEVRPYVKGSVSWHDQALELWVAIIQETRSASPPPV
jgi:hypothetical protein